jgi:regulator of replication initiation timing
MFKRIKDLLNAKAQLKAVISVNHDLAQENSRLREYLKAEEGVSKQRLASINSMQVRLRENEDHIDNLQRSKEDLRKENTKLREGAGHALHALAAVQDLSNAFVKRLDMLPEWCGLPKELVESVFQEFDTDLQERRKAAQEIERQSCTLEHEATDSGILVDGDNETRNLTLPEIQEAILNQHPTIKKWLHDLKLKPEAEISELGLFTIGVDLGKNVTTNIKLWVVPEA